MFTAEAPAGGDESGSLAGGGGLVLETPLPAGRRAHLAQQHNAPARRSSLSGGDRDRGGGPGAQSSARHPPPPESAYGFLNLNFQTPATAATAGHHPGGYHSLGSRGLGGSQTPLPRNRHLDLLSPSLAAAAVRRKKKRVSLPGP